MNGVITRVDHCNHTVNTIQPASWDAPHELFVTCVRGDHSIASKYNSTRILVKIVINFTKCYVMYSYFSTTVCEFCELILGKISLAQSITYPMCIIRRSWFLVTSPLKILTIHIKGNIDK